MQFSIALYAVFLVIRVNTIACFASFFVTFSANHFRIFIAPNAIWNAPTPNNGAVSVIGFR